MSANKVHLEIITPDKIFYSKDVEMVIVEEMSGKEGFMAGHTPALKSLKKGTVEIIESQEGERKYICVSGGYISVEKNIIIFTAEAK